MRFGPETQNVTSRSLAADVLGGDFRRERLVERREEESRHTKRRQAGSWRWAKGGRFLLEVKKDKVSDAQTGQDRQIIEQESRTQTTEEATHLTRHFLSALNRLDTPDHAPAPPPCDDITAELSRFPGGRQKAKGAKRLKLTVGWGWGRVAKREKLVLFTGRTNRNRKRQREGGWRRELWRPSNHLTPGLNVAAGQWRI